MLAIVSLAGVIVSHILVLSDFIEQARGKGMPLEEALVRAGLARLRPVLVTVFATVGGLIPLFLTGGTLWHPLAYFRPAARDRVDADPVANPVLPVLRQTKTDFLITGPVRIARAEPW